MLAWLMENIYLDIQLLDQLWIMTFKDWPPIMPYVGEDVNFFAKSQLVGLSWLHVLTCSLKGAFGRCQKQCKQYATCAYACSVQLGTQRKITMGTWSINFPSPWRVLIRTAGWWEVTTELTKRTPSLGYQSNESEQVGVTFRAHMSINHKN